MRAESRWQMAHYARCGDTALSYTPRPLTTDPIPDIVQRLRDPRYMHPPRGMLEEAADEIDRLRAALFQARLPRGNPFDQSVNYGIR
jgi:hypothetical protein